MDHRPPDDTGNHAGRVKRAVYERMAPLYDLLELPFEYGRYRRLRRGMFRDLDGRILDAGIGSGRNIPFYPPGADVVGIDVSPAMLGRARRRARRHGVAVELLERDVTRTGFADGAFDAVVATFLFCVLDEAEQLPALRELGRITKPEGEIRLLDYVLPPPSPRRWIAGLWTPWIRWAYGASFERRPERHARAAGVALVETRFVVDRLIRTLTFRPCRR